MQDESTAPSELCVALVPVGRISHHTFATVRNLLQHHTNLDLINVTAGHTTHGSLSIRLLSHHHLAPTHHHALSPQIVELKPHRLVRAIIGLTHCPSEPDLLAAAAHFHDAVVPAFAPSSERRPATRLVVLEPPPEGLAELELEIGSVVLPPKPLHELGLYLERLLEDLAAEMLATLRDQVARLERNVAADLDEPYYLGIGAASRSASETSSYSAARPPRRVRTTTRPRAVRAAAPST